MSFFVGASLMVGLLSSVFMGVSQMSFFSGWVCLEVNMLMFLALMSVAEKSAPSASMKYFIIQSVGSSLVLWAVGLESAGLGQMGEVCMGGALGLKLGIAPFHSWFISVLSTLSWELVFVASTLQKILPLFLLSVLKQELLLLFMGLSVLVSVLGSMNQTFLKKILAYSSIFMTVWLMACEGAVSKSLEYLMAYSNALGVVVVVFSTILTEEVSAMLRSLSGSLSIMAMAGFLSMSGCPPFVGFYAKILVMSSMMSHHQLGALFVLVLASVFLLYIYMRMFYFSLSAEGDLSISGHESRVATGLALGLSGLLLFPGLLCLGVVHSKLWTFSV